MMIQLRIILFIILLSSLKGSAAQQQPNIIFLLTDDHRWDAVGYSGNSIIKTPNLDRLAENGIIFENAFVSSSICCSSRASILTGQHLARHKVNTFDIDLTTEQLEFTYPLVLKQAGYQIGFIGKYGVGLNHPTSSYDYWECPPEYQPHYHSFEKDGNPIHHTDLVANQISEALMQFTEKDKPFCLSVSFKAPHVQDEDPWQFLNHPRYDSLYQNVKIIQDETSKPEYWDYFPNHFKENNEGRRRWSLRFDTDKKYQHIVKSYYRLITHVDDIIGMMMQQLKEKGLEKNTIIIFMGDNGFFLGEHGLAGKWFPYEESIRVPLMIYDPRNTGGKRIKEMALNIDVAPTILSYAKVQIPEVIQGKPLQSLFSHKNINWRKAFFYEFRFPPFPQHCEALVTERFKYIIYPNSQPMFEELYDLKTDPFETKNIIEDKKFDIIKNDLLKEFKITKKNAQSFQ